MKLTIDRDPLLAAVTRVSGALERKASSPVFSHILLDASDGKLTLRAMSADMQATLTVDAHVSASGTITAPGDELGKIASALAPGAQVTMEPDGERLLVKAGRSRWRLPTVPTDLMAEWPAVGDMTTFTLAARTLASALSRTLFAAAKDSNKGAMLQGVFVHTADDGLRFVATDAHRLALVCTGMTGEFDGCVMAARFVSEAIRVLDGAGECSLTVGPSRSELVYGPLRLVSKVLDGKYVPYQRTVPDYADSITVDRAGLQGALKRVNAVVPAVRRLKLTTLDGELHVDSRAMDGGEAADELACEREGEPFSVLVNSGYLGEALAQLEEPSVTFRTGTAKQPVVIVEGDLTQLIVPQVVESEG